MAVPPAPPEHFDESFRCPIEGVTPVRPYRSTFSISEYCCGRAPASFPLTASCGRGSDWVRSGGWMRRCGVGWMKPCDTLWEMAAHVDTSATTAVNRWIIPLGAVLVHICIGSVYAWSTFSRPIQALFP